MKALNCKGDTIEVDEKELAHKLHDGLAKDVAKLLESEEVDLDGGATLEASCFMCVVPTVNQLIADVRAILETHTKKNFFKLRVAALTRAEEEKERLVALATAFGISEEEIQQRDQLQRQSETQFYDIDG